MGNHKESQLEINEVEKKEWQPPILSSMSVRNTLISNGDGTDCFGLGSLSTGQCNPG
jgi:hypothetical protein